MLIFILIGLAGVVPLVVMLRQNAREQRAMNEAYDLWRSTGAAVPGWDGHYAWSEPLPVDEPAWAEPLGSPHRTLPRSTPPLPSLRMQEEQRTSRGAGLRWDEAVVLRADCGDWSRP